MASRPPTRRRSASAMHSATEPIRRTIARLSLRIVVMAPLRTCLSESSHNSVPWNRCVRVVRPPTVSPPGPSGRPADAAVRPDIGRGTPTGIAADCVRGGAATLRSAAMTAPVRAAPVIGHGSLAGIVGDEHGRIPRPADRDAERRRVKRTLSPRRSSIASLRQTSTPPPLAPAIGYGPVIAWPRLSRFACNRALAFCTVMPYIHAA